MLKIPNFNKKIIIKQKNFLINFFNYLNNFIFIFNFFYFLFKFNQTFNYFKKIYINFDYFKFFNIKNSKKEFLYYYIQFKKQNSLLKKKYMFLNTLNPIYFKKNLKKKFTENRNLNKLNVLKNTKNLYLFNKNSYNNSFNTLNGKKKLKKTILLNRFYLNYLNNFYIKRSKKLTKNINLKSKQKISNIIVSYQYSLINVINSINLFKSYNDIFKLIRSKNIFVNKINLTKFNYILNVGDLVEFNINYKLYNYFIYLNNISNKFSLKLKNKLWFKIKNNNKLNLKSNYLNKSLNLQNNYKSIQEFIEFDYYTLTIFVLYKNLKISNLNINIKKLLTIYLFKLYNWK